MTGWRPDNQYAAGRGLLSLRLRPAFNWRAAAVGHRGSRARGPAAGRLGLGCGLSSVRASGGDVACPGLRQSLCTPEESNTDLVSQQSLTAMREAIDSGFSSYLKGIGKQR
jgi:hypothetical protein